jgi:hypothetical protein
MVKVGDQAHFERFQGRWSFRRCLRPPTSYVLEAPDLDWLVRRSLMNGFVVQLQNSNTAVDTDEKRLQIEHHKRNSEADLKAYDRQGQ